MIKVSNLKTEYRANPLAVDCEKPRFFWQIESENKNVIQSSYRICVATSKELLISGKPDMYDSGTVESDETVGIEYDGKKLSPKTDYYWSVESCCGKAGKNVNYSGYFRTGLMGKINAKWIENGEIVPEDSPMHAGFMSKTVKKDSVPLKITVDLGKIRDFDCVAFYGLRIYEYPGIADYPGYQFPRSYRIYAQRSLKSEKIILEDRSKELVANPGAVPVYVFTEKKKARYITFEATKLQAFDKGKYSFGLSQMEIFNGSEKISEGCRALADKGWYDGEGFGPDKITDGTPTWHKAGNAKPLPGPYMLKKFTMDEIPSEAYVFVSALGLYELYINGKKVSDTFLAPEWTNYDAYVQYSTYEVSKMLRKGENEIKAMLGDGWYSGRLGMANVFGPKVLRGKYGKTPKFIMELDIKDKQGSFAVISTDKTWLSAANTPVRENDIYDGEFYDARFEDKLIWNNAREVDEKVTENIKIESFLNEPVKSYEILKPKSVTEPKKGIYVVDFGKNVSGFCGVTMKGKCGQKVLLRHAGGLKKDGTGYFANLRGAFATDTYIFKNSKKVTFRPHFTYHGFRYLEITGLGYKPELSDVICYAISSGFDELGKMTFENDFYNWLLRACKGTIRSNLVGVVTDCNDRDERLPWLMEGLESQSYIFDGALFWERHMHEIVEAFNLTGKRITQAPDALEMGIPDGAVARTFINIAELEYMLYGNKRLLEYLYGFFTKLAENNRKLYPDYISGNPYYCDCDWLNTNKIMAETGLNKKIPQVSEQVFGSITNVRFYRMMYEIAEILGKKDDLRLYKAQFDAAIEKTDSELIYNKALKNGSQAAYGMMLFFKTFKPENERMFVSNLKKLAEKSDYRFITGVYTVGALIRAMSDHGMHDIAYRMMTDSRCPSFKYMMDDGSETIWERWDTHMKELPDLYEKPRWQIQNKAHTVITENGYEDISMNSFNHIEYTTITPWITENVMGLRTDMNSGAGMKHFIFKTDSYKENKSAKGIFETIRGKIKICWKCSDEIFECKISIPANTSCTFIVPVEYKNVFADGKKVKGNLIELGSGEYYIKALIK